MDENINLNLEDCFYKQTGMKFKDFYKKQQPKLVNFLKSYTNDTELAENFAQDAFVQSLLKIEQYDCGKSKLHTWLYKIAENLAKKDWKDNKRFETVSMDKKIDEETTLSDFIKHYDNTETKEYDVVNMKAKCVYEAIDSLPEKYRDVIEMREIENMQYKDISDCLGINLQTIKNRIRKGRSLIVRKVKLQFKEINENEF